MKSFWIGLVLTMSFISLRAQHFGYTPLKSGDRLQDKVFYFFTLLEQPKCRIPLQKDTFLVGKLEAFKDSLANGGEDPNAQARGFIWSTADIVQVGNALCAASPSMQSWLAAEMRRSGNWIRDAKQSDTGLIRKGWEEAAEAENKLIQHFTTNKGFRYADIDSASLAPESEKGRAFMQGVLAKASKDSLRLFFQPGLSVALYMLKGNKRDEAIRFEPLDSTNRDAYARLKHTHWKKHEFAAILILGAGPDDDSAMNSTGRERCQQGALAWKQGKAPFIIVSGGFVHPFQTPYCEADQMKKYLIHDLGIPSDVIIMEPHARHTTTNVRNASRILIRRGVPLEIRVLTISSPLHILVVASPLFAARCLNEMGYVPYKEMKPGKNKYECSFALNEDVLQIDATDPLDP